MSKRGLFRHYDKLEPKERFRLDVLAMARGDMQESERLVSSCPKLPYTKLPYKMNDRAFTGRWTGALELTLRAYLSLADYLAKLQMVGGCSARWCRTSITWRGKPPVSSTWTVTGLGVATRGRRPPKRRGRPRSGL
jgi:hypothetical protein